MFSHQVINNLPPKDYKKVILELIRVTNDYGEVRLFATGATESIIQILDQVPSIQYKIFQKNTRWEYESEERQMSGDLIIITRD